MDHRDEALSEMDDRAPASPAPGAGEKLARRGYGYQDKAAADRILRALRDELRTGAVRLEGVKLADELAGRVDDCVLVWPDRVEGNSIKWRSDQKSLNWGPLVGTAGLLRELANGFQVLKKNYPRRQVTVRLQTSNPAETSNSGRLVRGVSVAQFLHEHWTAGAEAADTEVVRKAWEAIEAHTGLSGDALDEFVNACELCFGVPESPIIGSDNLESRHYRQQFNALQAKLATWHSNHPGADIVPREFLLDAIGLPPYEPALVQRFPSPAIPYERNQSAAERLQHMIRNRDGGYVAVTGSAGAGKSTLVQDVLHREDTNFVPYFAYLPNGEGDPRDRGEALTFFKSVVARLDTVFPGGSGIGVGNVPHGRYALRQHMEYAGKAFAESGRKTVLLVDGLDHVAREVGLRDSLMHQLPHPDQFPPGFLLVLSTRPEALLPGAIGSAVSEAVNAPENQVQVEGLSRKEVHQIAAKERPDASDADREALYRESRGNPLVLTYLFNVVETSPTDTFAEVIQNTASFTGDIDAFYADALGKQLEDSETRRLLGLLCRAAPTIPTDWLREWPESHAVEDLYQAVLAPFILEEAGNLSFIHNSLVSFLIERTRSALPGTDDVAEERAFYSELAERSAGRECTDPLGREHLFHLSRAHRLPEVLETAKSSWFRMSVRGFVPYPAVRPVVLEATRVAWELQEWAHIVRLVLLDAELAQRSGHLEPEELCREFLRLGEHELALAQVRSSGQLLIDPKGSLSMARPLWSYAERRNDQWLREASQRLYLDAKPMGQLLFGEPLKTRGFDDDVWDLMFAWSSAAPLFEPVEEVVRQVRALIISVEDVGTIDAMDARADMLCRSLRTAVSAKLGAAAEECLLRAIKETERVEWELCAMLLCARQGKTTVPASSLLEAFRNCDKGSDLGLELAEHLHAIRELVEARKLVQSFAPVRFDYPNDGPFWVHGNLWPAVVQACLRERLGLGQCSYRAIEDGRDEAMARVERAAQRLGTLLSCAEADKPPASLRDRFREVLFYASRPVEVADYDVELTHFVDGSRRAIFSCALDVAKSFGTPGMLALRDLVIEIVSSSSPFLGAQCREFAVEFRDAGVLSMADAVQLALSFADDTEDDDPMIRQQACLDMACCLRMLGASDWRDWLNRAGRVSAGAGSHKDHRMAHLADWLDNAMTDGPMTEREAQVLDKFTRTLEASGGAGKREAAKTVLRIVLRKMPSNATALTIEMIDRELLSVSSALEALLTGAKEADVSIELSSAIFEELLSLLAPRGLGRAAVAILDAVPSDRCGTLATRFMKRVRTNTPPAERIEVARSLLDALAGRGAGELDLAAGLPPGRYDDSEPNALYRLGDGRTLTICQVAARLRTATDPEEWDPNPEENNEFYWWRALREARPLALDRLEAVLSRCSPPEYREVEVLAHKAEALHAIGRLGEAREAAEAANKVARRASWFLWHDGAQRRTAFGALRVLEPENAMAQARHEFGENLASGNLNPFSLESELSGLFEFLALPWPREELLETIEEYLDEVEGATATVDRYAALGADAKGRNADEALCRFLVTLCGVPPVHIASGARRALATYLAGGVCSFINKLVDDDCWSDTELEYILIALDVAGRKTPGVLGDSVKLSVAALNRHESLGVRSVARRICKTAGWSWDEVRNERRLPRVFAGADLGGWSRDGSDRLVDRDVVQAWNLFKSELSLLEGEVNWDDLESEFKIRFMQMSDTHRWTDNHRRGHWATSFRGPFSLSPLVLVGRAAAMRLLGRYALEGAGPEWAEKEYDLLSPHYDPALELQVACERPSELHALDWNYTDERRKAWIQGTDGDDWRSYPDRIDGLNIIGEVTFLLRPAMEMFRETRIRGILADVLNGEESLSIGQDLTQAKYRFRGDAAPGRIVGHNQKGLLGAGVHQWAALNVNVANALGWKPSETDPFGWVGVEGDTKAQGLYWRDGSTSTQEISSEVVGEGWCLLASDSTLAELRRLVPEAKICLHVKRECGGETDVEHSWNLSRPL